MTEYTGRDLLKTFNFDPCVLYLLMKLEVDGMLAVILAHHLLKLQTDANTLVNWDCASTCTQALCKVLRS